MMKILINDFVLGRTPGDVVEMDDRRAQILIDRGMAERVLTLSEVETLENG